MLRTFRCLLTYVIGCVLLGSAHAFPPAPDHQIYGYVRDEQGVPLNRPDAEVWLEGGDRLLVKVPITTDPQPGVNYRLSIPVDSALVGSLYKPNALQPSVPFRLRVRIGSVTYLPIQMTGASNLVARPGASSRVDLTLGVDSDGDGLPDSWERNYLAALGKDGTVSDVNPRDDGDGDGLSNLDEYLAGTYAFDPEDGFVLSLQGLDAGRPVLEFMAIRGRSYEVHGSTDLDHWTPLEFTLPTDPASTPRRSSYRATDTRVLRVITAPPAPGEAGPRFFKLFVF